MLKGIINSNSGNVAMIAALLAPLLIGTAGGAVDVAAYEYHKRNLQRNADAAVLAAATEASLKGWKADIATSYIDTFVATNLDDVGGGTTYEHQVNVDEQNRRIRLDLEQDHYPYFFLGYFKSNPQIRVTAIATLSGQTDICIITTALSGKETFRLSGSANLNAVKCSAYSNSKHPKGLSAAGMSRLRTQFTCSGGGFVGGSGNYTPLPLRDCPSVQDPLSRRSGTIASSLSNSCTYGKTEIKKSVRSLSPGTYCGGLKITDESTVFLQPGVYIIKDGKFVVDKNSTIKGEEVSFVFEGDKAVAEFKNKSIVSLSAPSGGALAGILMHAVGPNDKPRTFKIESENAHKFTGLVHLPDDKLIVGGDQDGDGVCDIDLLGGEDADGSEVAVPGCNANIGRTSAWTAIIAKELEVTNGVNLVINAEYKSSTVPVPEGLGPTSGEIRLVK